MHRRIASFALSSVLATGVLVGVSAPPAEAAGTCGAGATNRSISGTEYCFWYRTSAGPHTWSVPIWVGTIDVLLVGAGANGKEAGSTYRAAAGGAAGKVLGRGGVSVVPGDSVSVFVERDGGSKDTTVSTPGRTFKAPAGAGGSNDGSGGGSGKDINLASNLDSPNWTNYSGGSYDSNTSSSAYTYAGGGGAGAGGVGSGGSAGGTQAVGGTGGSGISLSSVGFYAGSISWVACGGGGGASAYSVTANTAIAGEGGSSCSGGKGAKATYASGGDTSAEDASSSSPGSGGGGGAIHQNSSSTATGGSGSDGMVIIRYLALVKTLSLSDGAGQQPAAPAPSGYPLAKQPVVQLRDGTSNDLVADETVTATTSAPCSLSGTDDVLTDDSGVATFTDLALSRDLASGSTCTIKFSNATYGDVTSNLITVTPGPAVAANSTVSVADDSLQVASPGNTSAITVQLKDDAGNSLGSSQYAAFGPYDISLNVTGAAGSVGTVTDDTDGTYSATFTGGTETGTATVGGTMSLGSGASGTAGSLAADTVLMTPGAKIALEIGTEPASGSAYSGQVLGTQPVVNVVDAFGNTVTTADDSVTAAVELVAGSGSPSLAGTNPEFASSGVATFTDLAVTGNATSTYRLNFTADGLTGVSSSTFPLAKEPQYIVWDSGSSATKTFGDASFSIGAHADDTLGVATGLPVTFSSSNEAVCTVSGADTAIGGVTYATVAITGAGGGGGTCVVTASQAGNDDYAAATSAGLTYTVNKANQSSLSLVADDTAVYGTDLTLVGTGGSSSKPLSWGASSGPCTVTGTGATGTLEPTGIGTCVVTLNRADDSNYLAASQVTKNVVIIKRDQVVAFTSSVPIEPKSFQTYTAEFSSSLGGSYVPSVAVTTGDGTVCSRVDNGDGTATVSFLASGTCTLTATEAGDSNTNAGSATQTIVVDSINQNITFPAIADRVFGVAPFALGASTSSGRAVTYTSTTPAVCSVGSSSGVLRVLDKGECSVTVTRPADAQYAAANPITRSFVVSPALATKPFITSVSPGDTRITTSFAPPGFTGAPSESIVGYEVTATPVSGPSITQSCDDTTTPLVCTMTGLANGTDYRMTVAAVNTAGVGPSSEASGLLRPVTSANAVGSAFGVPGADGTSVHLYWQPLDDTVATLGGGSFTRYDIYQRVTGGAWPATPIFTSTDDTTADFDVTGLTTGVTYDFKIVAITTANATEVTGNTAIVTEYPSTVPGAVTDDSLVELGKTAVEITWDVPVSDGGSVITEYTVSAAGVPTCRIDPLVDANLCVFTGLERGETYRFAIEAINRMGAGEAVVITHTTPPIPPPAPLPPAPPFPPGPQPLPDVPPTPDRPEGMDNNWPIVITPTPGRGGDLILTGPNFSLDITAITAEGKRAPVGPDVTLRVTPGGQLIVEGGIYSFDSDVSAYLIPAGSKGTTGVNSTQARSEVVASATGRTTKYGKFIITLSVPAEIPQGDYILQVNGYSLLAEVRSVNVAVVVEELAQITISAERMNSGRVLLVGQTVDLTPGLALQPMIRLSGQSTFSPGVGLRTVKADGSFTWKRNTSRKRSIEVYFTVVIDPGEVDSNVVKLPRIRKAK